MISLDTVVLETSENAVTLNYENELYVPFCSDRLEKPNLIFKCDRNVIFDILDKGVLSIVQ